MMICKTNHHEFWQIAMSGAKDAGEELGIEVTFRSPKEETQLDEQKQILQKAIDDKVDGILLAPLDTEKLNLQIMQAKDKKIPVMTFDSDVTAKERVSNMATDNISAGAIAARNAISKIGTKGKIAIIAPFEHVQTAQERIKGFCDEVEKQKNLEIVSVKYSENDIETAKTQAEELQKQYPDLKCIFATNEGCTVGVLRGLQDKGTTVIGVDSSDTAIDALKNGTLEGLVVQNPYNMGYLGVRNLYKTIRGQETEEHINTGVTYINKDNLGEEDIQWLLYPMGKK